MASTGKELLGEHYGRDHLTYEEIEESNLEAVTGDGRTLARKDLRGRIFCIADRDEPSGYVVKSMESTGIGAVLCYLRAAS